MNEINNISSNENVKGPPLEANQVQGSGHLPGGQIVHVENDQKSEINNILPNYQEVDNQLHNPLGKEHHIINDSQDHPRNQLNSIRSEEKINESFSKLDNYQLNREALVGVLFTENQMAGILFQVMELGAVGAELGIEGKEILEGREFVEALIPSKIQENLKFFEHLEGFSQFLSWGSLILSSTQTGLNALALIYKTSMLEQAEKIMDDAIEQLNAMRAKGVPEEQLEKIKQSLNEWATHLEIQRTALSMERNLFGFSLASTTIKVISTPLNFIPVKYAEAAQAAGVILSGTSYVLKGLEVIITGIEFLHTRHNKHQATEWIEEHQQWSAAHQITYNTVKIKLEEAFDRFIMESSFEHIKQVLKNKGIVFDTNKIKTKDDFKIMLASNPEVKKGICNAIKNELAKFSTKLELQNTVNDIYIPDVGIESKYKDEFNKDFPVLIEKLEFEDIKLLLSRIGFTLDTNIKNKDDIKKAWENNIEFKEKVLESYLNTQKNFDRLIFLSKDLLEKRENIRNKQVNKILLNFNEKKEKIEELQQKSFDLSMMKIFNELNKKFITFDSAGESGLRSYQLIEDELNKWITPAMRPFYQDLFDALDVVKQAEVELAHIRAHPDQYDESWKTAVRFRSFHSNFKEKAITILGEEVGRQVVFDTWKGAQGTKKDAEYYVDHQETVEKTTKNALKEMIEHKHNIERQFIDFKNKSAKRRFIFAAFAFAVTATLGVLTLMSITFPLMGAIFVGLSVASALLSMYLLGKSLQLSFTIKSSATRAMLFEGIYFRVAYLNLRAGISNYGRLSKHAKLLKLENKITALINEKKDINWVDKDTKKLNKMFLTRHQLNEEIKEIDAKVDEWNDRLKTMKLKVSEKGWGDFAKQAALQVNIDKYEDSLERLKDALNACDFSLLSDETKELLRKQLGIDVNRMQQALEKNPEAFKIHLLKFFGSSDADLLFFIRKQRNFEEKRLAG